MDQKPTAGFTVGYRSYPHMVRFQEVTRPKPRCPKCGGYLEVIKNSFQTKYGNTVTVPEGDCMQCGFHVWDLNHRSADNPSGVYAKAFTDAALVPDVRATPDELEAVEVVLKIKKEKRVPKNIRRMGESTLDRLLAM